MSWFDSRRATWTIVAIGLAARLLALAWIGNAPLADDALDYHTMALALRDGTPISTDWPPGVALWLVPFSAVFGTSALVARLAMLLWYFGLAAAMFGVAGRLGGRRAANVAIALCALYPAHVFQATLPLTQLPCAALLMTALYLALRVEAGQRAWRWALPLCGLALGAAVLVRPPSLLCCAALPVVLALRTRRVRHAALPLAIAATVVSLWLVKVHDVAGRFVFINDASSQNFFYGNNEWTPRYRTWWFGSHKYPDDGVPRAFAEAHAAIGKLPPALRDEAFSRQAVTHIKARPDLFVVRSLSRARTYVALDTFVSSFLVKQLGAPKLAGLGAMGVDALHYLLIVALAVAFACARRETPLDRSQRTAIWLSAAIVLCYSAPYLISFSHPTYHFPVVPIAAVLAAQFAARPSRLERPRTFAALMVVLALIQVEWVLENFSRV
jgi:4-amino-4-deoxy-L-arabinose transferase-like glycosyltransferase